MKGRALLFGLNYEGTASELHGCVQDVIDIGGYIERTLRLPTKVCTDAASTTAVAIVQGMYELALQSHSESLDFVWIHYSGHGAGVVDRSGDERDGRDECLVPSDYATAGLIPDDFLERIFRHFNRNTRVVFVCDACHSGTMCDVKYSWESATKCTVENVLCAVPARVLTLSGCMDDQTSADAFDLKGDGKSSGALTSCLIRVLTAADGPAACADVFVLLSRLTAELARAGFPQRPKLCSTYNLAREKLFVQSSPS